MEMAPSVVWYTHDKQRFYCVVDHDELALLVGLHLL